MAVDKMTLIEEFQADCKIRSITGIKIYTLYAREFSEFLKSKNKEPQDATRDDLKAYLIALRERGLKQSSIDRVFTIISGFYAFMMDEGIISSNPILPFRKRYFRKFKDDNGSEIRQFISIEQAAILINSILNSRDKAMMTLLFKTGMRRGELCRLDIEDIDMKKMEIMLKQTAKRSNRRLFFDYETADILHTWLKARKTRTNGTALFPSNIADRISPAEVDWIVKKHAEHVGLHNSRSKRLEDRFTPHCCRHWFTTHLRRAGMPREFIQELRGDARKEAIDIYDHIDKKELRESYLAHIPQLGI
jgi:integrase/recombinase XerD